MQQQEVYFGRPALRLAALTTPALGARWQAFAALLSLVRAEPRLPLSLLRQGADDTLEELPLNQAREQLLPVGGVRHQEYLRELIERAAGTQRFTVGHHRGFSDFVVPLGADGDGKLFLHGAQFVLQPLDWDSLLTLWRDRSGLSKPSAEPAFVRFVTTALGRPVLEGERLERLRQLSAALRRALSESGSDEASSSWRPAGASSGMTLALRLLPPPSPESHPLKLRVEVYRAEHACRELLEKWLDARETSRDDGCLLLHAERCLGQQELAARVAELGAMLQRRFGMRLAVGVGRGGADEPAAERALSALQRALRQGQEHAFADDAEPVPAGAKYSELTRAVDRLIEAFERVALGDAMIAADDYVRTLSAWASGRPGAVREQLLTALAAIAKNVARRNVLSPEVADHFIDDVCQRLERAGGYPHQVEEFKQGLLRLALFASDGPSGLHCMRLDKTLEYLKEHCSESLRLPRVARRAGFSVPTFSRAFKRATGTSFARYLRGLRVARAQELLKTTNLSGERIAELCGFRNQHHLIRSFKQVTGQTPGAFREEALHGERC